MAGELVGKTNPEDHVKSESCASSSRSAPEASSPQSLGRPARYPAFFVLVVLAFSGVLLLSVFADAARAVTVSTFAGAASSVDGTGSTVRFYDPIGICYNSANGNLYVTDAHNHTVRRVTSAGAVTTVAGSPGQRGSADGAGSAARFDDPYGICYNSANGNLYVVDGGNHTIRQVTPAGVVTTLAGSPGQRGGADGTGSAARFDDPIGICYNSANGNLYVVDGGNHTIRQVTPAGVVTTLAGSPGQRGSADGTGSAARFDDPYGICYNSGNGNLYITDTGNTTIRQVTPAGVVTTLAGSPGNQGSADGTGSAARFSNPAGMCFDSGNGNLYITDWISHTIRQVTPAGVVTTLAGSPGQRGQTDGTGSTALFDYPVGICYDSANSNLSVIDGANQTIRQVTRAGVVTTLACGPADWGSTDGTRSAARFYHPYGICLNPANGNLYVADTYHHTIRQVTPAGVVTTLAGSPGNLGSADGTGSAARFNNPCGICYNSRDGNLYVTDTNNNTIRQVTPAGVVTTLAGSPGNLGSADGTGSAARFNFPWGICFDPANSNLYVADAHNNTIRRVTPAGVVTTLAGSPGQRGSTDGTGSAARFDDPVGICYESANGYFYVTDSVNNTIRRVTPAGVVTTLAGSPGQRGSADGTGSAARFNNPGGICFDGANARLYVADTVNHTVRQVTPAGVVVTLAGSPGSLGSTDGTGNAALFSFPEGICHDPVTGNLYVADMGNSTIRMVTLVSQTPKFSDIAASPYRAAILDLALRGVINGFPDGTFRPHGPVSRQQFAKMIVKTRRLPVSVSDLCPFTDVGRDMDPQDPLYPDHYVAVCTAHGITEGTGAGRFSPYANLTRAQLITMVARASNLAEPPAEFTPPFGDFSPEHYPWARKAAYAGLLGGVEGMGPHYDFWAQASRGEVAQMLDNLLVAQTASQ